jgi:hypothetical protein
MNTKDNSKDKQLNSQIDIQSLLSQLESAEKLMDSIDEKADLILEKMDEIVKEGSLVDFEQ